MKSEEWSQANELGYVVKSEECSQLGMWSKIKLKLRIKGREYETRTQQRGNLRFAQNIEKKTFEKSIKSLLFIFNPPYLSKRNNPPDNYFLFL